MKTITTEPKIYLVTSRSSKGVSYWIDEKKFNEAYVLKTAPLDFEPVMTEGKDPQPVCKVATSKTVNLYLMVNDNASVSQWVLESDVSHRKWLGWKLAPGEADPDDNVKYQYRHGFARAEGGHDGR
jgi:hypothetical protein